MSSHRSWPLLNEIVREPYHNRGRTSEPQEKAKPQGNEGERELRIGRDSGACRP